MLDKIQLLKDRASTNKKTSIRYHEVDTEALLASLDRTLKANGWSDYSIRWSFPDKRAKSTAHFMRIRLGSNLVVGEVRPEIVVMNSFNGECLLDLMVGMYRMVCSNGLTVGEGWFHESVRHVRGPKMATFLEEFEQKIVWALRFIELELPKRIEQMKSIPIDTAKMIAIVEGLNLSAKAKEKVRELRARPVRSEDAASNAWTLYNTVNEVLRFRSRSEFANEKKNTRLMDDILRLAA
jgi:hypothetical protein